MDEKSQWPLGGGGGFKASAPPPPPPHTPPAPEFNYDIFDILRTFVNVTVYPQHNDKKKVDGAVYQEEPTVFLSSALRFSFHCSVLSKINFFPSKIISGSRLFRNLFLKHLINFVSHS
jgi:hypothetical protein